MNVVRGGANLDPLRALTAAVEEALLSRVLLNNSREMADPAYAHQSYETLNDHLLAHATDPSLLEALAFLTASSELLTLGDLREQWPRLQGPAQERLVEVMRSAGLEPLSVAVTTTDVADTGLHLVGTLVRGLQPLDNSHAHRHFGGRRLYSAPEGLGSGPRTLADLSPDTFP